VNQRWVGLDRIGQEMVWAASEKGKEGIKCEKISERKKKMGT